MIRKREKKTKGERGRGMGSWGKWIQGPLLEDKRGGWGTGLFT
jgi:hypothetical protein